MSRHLRPITAAALTGLGLLLTSTPASAQPDPNLPGLPGAGGWITCQCETGPATALTPPSLPTFPGMVPPTGGEDEPEAPPTGQGEPEAPTGGEEPHMPGGITVGDVTLDDVVIVSRK
ncbi:hypothetical protein ACFOWE_30295 [Planomonospora corallina]|uniref:Uncharacterized protein n=1 Tax=Planomonospora corallina TaxID=1806052 RepID=A0ABV8IGE7_9ACTN